MEPESKNEWRERGRLVIRMLENRIDGLAADSHVFEELLNDSYNAEECRRLAEQLKQKLDALEASRLYDSRRIGLRRDWILIPVEVLLERGLGREPTAAEMMIVLDAAGLGKGGLPDLDTFRRNRSDFEKRNPQLVHWIRRTLLGTRPS